MYFINSRLEEFDFCEDVLEISNFSFKMRMIRTSVNPWQILCVPPGLKKMNILSSVAGLTVDGISE